MKSFRRLLSVALFILAFWSHQAAAADLRFVVWNIEWFPGLRPTASAEEADKHMKACQAELKKLNPDIFVAEEIHDWAAFNELISAVPGLTTHVVSSFTDPATGELRPQQIGIASKLPCHGAWWEPWKANVPNISRGFSFAALESPAGLIMVYGNHLKSNGGSDKPGGAQLVADMRAEQTKQLLAHREVIKAAFAKEKIFGWIAAGDFNTNHDGQFPLCHVVDLMTKGGYTNTWANTPREKRLTWRSEPDSKFEPTTFDYIFTQGIPKTDAFIIDAPRELSDHYPVGLVIKTDS
ncbi:hypothetical protein JIN85_09840 [Luteolibacter pohnpeiensis]|uniref:Endonuclease/exonuclease/phosphatase domain-containing protein n=1 Tax=Luteolibacter pohnpeiensis TaxID=454153 RepID=A0A934S7M8_9BACT|nr:endonuclease/exonuclease/phosphatase family protein [Luteolibacter pohnpeiensis]MBK1882719.1 hypothetical protein [Luteolibacter pohnpeiensis]